MPQLASMHSTMRQMPEYFQKLAAIRARMDRTRSLVDGMKAQTMSLQVLVRDDIASQRAKQQAEQRRDQEVLAAVRK